MSNHDIGWTAVHYPNKTRKSSPRTKIGRQLLATATAVLLIGLVVYTTASADCATGGDCTIASGAWFQWLAKTTRVGQEVYGTYHR